MRDWRDLLPRRRSLLICLFLSLLINADPIDERAVLRYMTHPELSAPRLDINYKADGLLAEGYLFVAPWHTQAVSNGPFIYDVGGHLVWSGATVTQSELVMNFHVCEIGSEPHLCYFEGRSKTSWAQGRGAVLDSTYRLVRIIENEEASYDMHELNLIDNGKRALVTAYTVDPFDGTSLGLGHGFSWLLNSHFHEIDVESGAVNFEWQALSHIHPANSRKPPSNPDARTRHFPYDFFHLNSVVKSRDGDYIICARHMNAIYKVSRHDGHIVWQLGGYNSTFRTDFDMCGQHHTRIRSESVEGMVLSVFNNGCLREEGLTTPAAGMVVSLDYKHMTATLTAEYNSQFHMHVTSQGSLEILDNGNAIVGWGQQAMITEHTADGRLIYNATLGNGHAQSYRVQKAEWHGHPTTKPKVYSFSKTHTAPTVIYVSWNGATEVSSWEFYGRNSTMQSYQLLGASLRIGFETNFTSKQHATFTMATALASDGLPLKNSSGVQTFVPSAELAMHCSEMLCPLYSMNQTLADLREEATRESQKNSFSHFGSVVSGHREIALILLLAIPSASILLMALLKWCSRDQIATYTGLYG